MKTIHPSYAVLSKHLNLKLIFVMVLDRIQTLLVLFNVGAGTLATEDRLARYRGTTPEEALTCPNPNCDVIETNPHFIRNCPAHTFERNYLSV